MCWEVYWLVAWRRRRPRRLVKTYHLRMAPASCPRVEIRSIGADLQYSSNVREHRRTRLRQGLRQRDEYGFYRQRHVEVCIS